MQQVLDICLNSKVIFEYALSNSSTPSGAENNTNAGTSSGGASGNNNNEVEFQKHILLFESRLQNALKTLIKLWLSAKDPKQKVELYKKMYMETLNIRKVAGSQHEQTSVNVLAQQFSNLLERLTQLERTHANAINNNSNNNNNNSKTN